MPYLKSYSFLGGAGLLIVANLSLKGLETQFSLTELIARRRILEDLSLGLTHSTIIKAIEGTIGYNTNRIAGIKV